MCLLFPFRTDMYANGSTCTACVYVHMYIISTLTHTPISWQLLGGDVWTGIYAAAVFTQVVFRSDGCDLYVCKPNVSTHDKNDVATCCHFRTKAHMLIS